MSKSVIADTAAEPQANPVLWNSNYLKVWVANFMLFFAFYLLTPLLPLYLRDTFAADKAMIGAVLSGYTLTALLVRPFSGFVVDTFPRKKVLLICYFCFALLFAGYFITASLLLFAVVRTLHGAPFGATTVANSTMAIDVLAPERRTEGIGYYGLSNNIAMATGPSTGLYLYHTVHDFNLLFALSLLIAFVGFFIDSTISCRERQPVPRNQKLSLDRFILLSGWSEGLCIVSFAFSFGVISTYIAIYSEEVMHITSGSGTFFMLLALGLILSRLVGSRSLRKGKIVLNASAGMTLSMFGYLLFTALPNIYGYYMAALLIGLGNGHMFPAMQTMFINLAPHDRRGTANSTLLTSWDIGIGIGIVGGGTVAEHYGGYTSAFWIAFAVNAAGVLFYFLHARGSFLRHRLR
ncbi:MAG: MFS transporter [Coprobacter sp.]|nr:MFS transporter [Coprobacter sp.]